MQKHLTIFILLFLSSVTLSQAPFSFNYQGLARDADGEPLADKDISLLISLISGFESGIIEFQEEHLTTTDPYGLFSIRIGEGDFLLGNLRNIQWGADSYFLRTEIDPDGGENYINLGTSQLHSVPYALFAAESGNTQSGQGSDDQSLFFDGTNLSIENGNSVNLSILKDGVEDEDADPANELQTLSIFNNQVSISGGNTIDLPTGGGGGSDNQTLSLNNTSLSITGGNSVDLASIGIDDDADPNNEIQTLSVNGKQLSILGGNTVDLAGISPDADADPANELQTLSIFNNQVSISGGNTIDLPTGGGGGSDNQTLSLNNTSLSITGGNSVDLASIGIDDDADPNNEIQTLSVNGKQLSILGGNTVDLAGISPDADADPANELQTLSIFNNQVSISGGNTIDLPTGGGGGSDNQTLSLNNTSLSITGGNSVDLASIGIDDDADPNNEIQTLSVNGKQLSILGGNTVDLAGISPDDDADPGNEIQFLGLNGDILSLSDGNSINLEAYKSPWVTEPFGITYNGNMINFQNPDLTNAVVLSRFQNGSGGIEIFGDVQRKIEIYPTVDDAGLVRTTGANGNLNILLSSIASDPNKAWLGAYDQEGENRASLFVASSGRGGAFFYGPNGNLNIDLTALGSNVNHGFIAVKDSNGDSKAGLYVDNSGNGRIFADFVDTFVDNPDKSDEKLIYSMIQGPEAAVYLRGTARLQNGQSRILFPSHFQNRIKEGSMTVMITPLSAESKGIAVIKKSKGGFIVKELLQGTGNYEFDWEVKGIRGDLPSSGFTRQIQPRTDDNNSIDQPIISPQKNHP